MKPNETSVYCVLIAALGGEGGGVLADWLVQCAQRSGLAVQATSVPGVAQRTGATSYYIEMLRAPLALGQARPVFALSPVPGRVDVVVASELLEAARMMERGFVTPDRTTLIASTHRVYTTIEKMHMADGRHDSDRIRQTARALAAHAELIDMEALASQSGTVVSAVMFGALSGAGVLPWPRDVSEAVIAASGRGAKESLAGFDLAHRAVESPAASAHATAQATAHATAQATARATAPSDALAVLEGARLPASLRKAWADRISRLPESTALIAAHGALRCLDYQGAAYSSEYLDRVHALCVASTADSVTALDEASRHLALWMCFEDVIRVADLKSRSDRVARVRREVQAGDGEIVRVTEFFKPGVDEIAAILPAAIGSKLLALAARRGWMASAVGLHIRSTSFWGFLMLRALAWLRPLRPWSLRYRQEHDAMLAWHAAMLQALPAAGAFALVLAGLPQVIKGYGETQRRGRENHARLWAEHVAPALASESRMRSAAAASAFAQAVRATLADPEGTLNIASRKSGETRPIFWARNDSEPRPRPTSQWVN